MRVIHPPNHGNLHLVDFTCFHDARFQFVPGVNVFVGENGSGKTHVLKVLYAIQKNASRGAEALVGTLLGAFRIERLGDLVARPRESSRFAYFGDPKAVIYRLEADGRLSSEKNESVGPSNRPRPVYIPAFDLIGHSKSFFQNARIVDLDFDSPSFDLLAFLGARSTQPYHDLSSVDSLLRKIAPGEFEQDETGRFHHITDHGSLPMPLVAEGIRKVATLRKLVENNWLVPGSTLFWDEPEVNLNPKLMDEVAQAIWLLARSGVQVFIASHSYLILKELEVAKQQDDSLRYFAFEPTDNGTVVHPSDTYLGIHPNPIEDQYVALYDRDLAKEIVENQEFAAYAHN